MPCVRIATGAWATGSEMKLIEAVQSTLGVPAMVRTISPCGRFC